MDSLMEEFAFMSAEVSPMRSTVINSASTTREFRLAVNPPMYVLNSPVQSKNNRISMKSLGER